METSIYNFSANSLKGEEIALSEFKGKTLIVVNTASKCGLTPQYEGLEKLYKKYKEDGLVILGFPCNQFASQEKGTSEDIAAFCQMNYGVSFPMFEKIKVNGKHAHPVYKYLKAELPGGILGNAVKWNFTKFVIDKNGTPQKRFAPNVKPAKMEDFIKTIL